LNRESAVHNLVYDKTSNGGDTCIPPPFQVLVRFDVSKFIDSDM
jgi:hypothetical protein